MKITDLFALYWAYPLINLAIDMIQARKAHLKGVICLTIGVLGVYIASGGMLGSLLTLEPALLYVGLASLCTALYFKANESWKIKEYPMLTRIFWHFLIGPATIAILYRNFSLSTLALVAPMGWVTFGLLALIPCLGGYYFAFKSIKKVGSVATGALSFLEPMVGVILAVVLWKESLTLLQVGGWVLIFISLFNIPKMNNKNE